VTAKQISPKCTEHFRVFRTEFVVQTAPVEIPLEGLPEAKTQAV
jgi:hypothetical protein